MKTILFCALFVMILSQAAYTQQDSTRKVFVVKGVTIEPGKLYKINLYNGYEPVCRLVGINDETLLVMINNETEEIKTNDIEAIIRVVISEEEDNSVSYSISKKYYEPVYYITGGLVNHIDIGNTISNSYSVSEDYGGFIIQPGVLFKFSDLTGVTFDLTYIHLNSSVSETVVGTPGRYGYRRMLNEYGNANDYFAKAGAAIGYLNESSKLNAYINCGIIFGVESKGTDIYNTYSYDVNGTYNTFTDAKPSEDAFKFGVFGSVRLNYQIRDNVFVIAETGLFTMPRKTGSCTTFSGGIGYIFKK